MNGTGLQHVVFCVLGDVLLESKVRFCFGVDQVGSCNGRYSHCTVTAAVMRSDTVIPPSHTVSGTGDAHRLSAVCVQGCAGCAKATAAAAQQQSCWLFNRDLGYIHTYSNPSAASSAAPACS